jgi:excinuclease ABC subunit C
MHWQHSIRVEGEATLSSLPEFPAVFALRGERPDSEPYLNKAANLRKRLERLLSSASPDTKRLNLAASTHTVEYTLTGSDFENRLLLYRALREQFPRSYRKRMKLIPSALVKIGWENEYPRAYFTRRLGRIPPSAAAKAGASESSKSTTSTTSIYYGPFASKAAANKFLNDALDLFKSRRCTFNIRPDPSFPGCMYSEMKMCLAPCFAGCTHDEYMHEIARVQQYLDSHGSSLVAQLEAERDAASAELEFEQASAIHSRIEKSKEPWTGIPEVVGRIDQLRAIIVQRSALPDHVALFEFREGLLHGPVQFNVQGIQHANPNSGSSSLYAHPHLAAPVPLEDSKASPKARPQTLESRVAEALAEIPAKKPERGEVADHLALLKRWYYRSTKKGEVFITHSDELPLRRIVRGISRVFRGENESGDRGIGSSGEVTTKHDAD